MNTETETKTELFKSKEHYFQFRQNWKDFINSGKAKKERKKDKDWTGQTITIVTPSPLSSEYHLFYSLAIGRSKNGFVNPSDGLDIAQQKLLSKYAMNVDKWKKVFGDTINEDMIKDVQNLLNA